MQHEGEAEEDVEIELLDKAEVKEPEAEEPGKDNAKADRHAQILQRVREQAGPEMADIVEEALKNARKPGKKTTHRVFRFPGGGEGHVVIKVDGVELGGDEKPAQKPPPVKEDF